MNKFEPSPFAMPFASRRVEERGQPPADTIMLGIGDPDFDTPEHIRKALVAAVESGATHYAGWAGDPELKAALAADATRRAGRKISESQIVLTHGGNAALASTILTVVGPGQRVVIPSPTYPVYATHVRAAGGEPVMVPDRADYHPDLDAIATASPALASSSSAIRPTPPLRSVLRRSWRRWPRSPSRTPLRALRRGLRTTRSPTGCLHLDAASAFAGGALAVRTDVLEDLADRLGTGYETRRVQTSRRHGAGGPPQLRRRAPLRSTAVQRAGLAAILGPQDEPERNRREYEFAGASRAAARHSRRRLVPPRRRSTRTSGTARRWSRRGWSSVRRAWGLGARRERVRPGWRRPSEDRPRVSRDILATGIGRLREVLEEER